jgi:CheY-like chemotaxis protein
MESRTLSSCNQAMAAASQEWFMEREERQPRRFSSQIPKLSYNRVMPRPTLLVAESESVEALSVRKLVLETGKFNVLTAHSFREALDLFHLFPNISAAVIVMDPKIDGENIARAIKSTVQKIPIIGRIVARLSHARKSKRFRFGKSCRDERYALLKSHGSVWT